MADASTFYETVARRIINLRTSAGLTQAQLSHAIGASRSLIANVESRRQRLGLYEAYRLAAALNVPLNAVVDADHSASESLLCHGALTAENKALRRTIERVRVAVCEI